MSLLRNCLKWAFSTWFPGNSSGRLPFIKYPRFWHLWNFSDNQMDIKNHRIWLPWNHLLVLIYRVSSELVALDQQLIDSKAWVDVSSELVVSDSSTTWQFNKSSTIFEKLIIWIFFRKKEHTHISVLSRKVLLEKYSIVFWWMIELILRNEYLIIVTFYNSGYSKKSRLSELAATISSNFKKAPKWIVSKDKSVFNLKIITTFWKIVIYWIDGRSLSNHRI